MGSRSCASLATLLAIFAVSEVEGSCEIEHISSNCEYYINCVNNIGRIHSLLYDTMCPIRSLDDSKTIFLFLDNVNLDLLTSNERNTIITDRLKKIQLNHVAKIPEVVKYFSKIEELTLTDWLDQNLDLNRFLELNLRNLIKINVSYSNIENLEYSYFQMYGGRSSQVTQIDLTYNLLEMIPRHAFYGFSSELKHLNLSHNLIQTTSFEGIVNLETLDLSFNRLVEIGQSFVTLSNLREIYLQNNNISFIQETDFNALVNLEKLNLSSNVLNSIEDGAFRALVNLKEIDLSKTKLTAVSKFLFWSNTKIYNLILANNKIQRIESNVFKGKKITAFDIKGNDLSGSLYNNTFKGIITDNLNLSNEKINTLEAAAFAGLQTQVLNLSKNLLTYIDAKSFKGIELIIELNLSNNNLTGIDFETEDMKQLLIFNARNNQITNVSHMSIKNFVALTKLDLSYNKITVLEPMLFFDLNELQLLDLKYNLLSGSVKANFFQGLSAVTDIYLENNRFTNIDSNAFSGLKALKILNCTSGQLASIHSDAFNNTGSLEILDLSQNILDNFTVNVASITSVKELRLNDNKIQNVLTKTISGVSCLEKLYFGNNNIIVLESKLFRKLKNLKVLDLSNNPSIDSNEVLSNISFLDELILTNIKNQFNFDSIINTSIARLDLSRNNIENINKVYVYRINDILYLDLHANKISCIDKDSFKNMHTLLWLDLSYNLITYIQPGAFLQTRGLKLLNLHENALSTLQYGVLNGLYDLETLNLSSNTIHEFRKSVLINTPKVTTIALDNNVIEHIKFDEFVPSTIKLITIGGNPISCHVIAQFMERKLFQVSAEVLDHHNESIHGIRCISNWNKNFNSYENTSGANGTAASWMIYKDIDKIRMTLDKILGSVDKINFKNDSEEGRSMQKSIINILKSINESQNNTNSYLKLQENAKKNDTIDDILRKINDSGKIHTTTHGSDISVKNELDRQLEEKIKTLNDENNKMMKEVLEIIEEFKSSKNQKSVTEFSHNNESFDGFKGVLYFVAVCLIILILFSVGFLLFMYLRPTCNLFKMRNEASCSTNQMANIIELQEN